ncbi:hypothetical protein GUITHDRAFT_134568 [Guillardia theta CCMP2712]|uniref:Cyclic nucleotide-binding domain-containing protein n=1 Tax=Guillardia theta (strain CCMP2712) TaxID=905079 RepID=L1JUB5_GUITC|nr:hypothetical protein GUITHDRAFT_134568 [Guillardia theta CCMP2712]EKX51683.1 hypothetical protein GUITHDRAFT_134568 [Guillardia theta CCMP2712]|eukprot:XP_005838663.1 hypothetical protein GUITHDRAFT_134568 [Guillardia theta CCMP2712]
MSLRKASSGEGDLKLNTDFVEKVFKFDDLELTKGAKAKDSVLIHPLSRFFQTWEFLSGILLLYTTWVTPLLIAFFSEQEGFCAHAPTLKFDMAVDLFFITEIFVQFSTGKLLGIEYILERGRVALIYLHHGFVTDVLAGLPISFLEYFLIEDTPCSSQSAGYSNSAYVRYLRLVRMLRMLRLLKVLKIFNVLRDFFLWRPTVVRLTKAAFSICMIAHIGGCLWWFLKLQELSHEELAAFKAEYNLDHRVSSPYIVSVYFLMATLCTVGYGDISAVTDYERLFAIALMFIGASVFAIIISNMSALVNSVSSSENETLDQMEKVLEFMRQNKLPQALERRVQNFYFFKASRVRSSAQSSLVLADLPVELRNQIDLALNRHLLGSIWLFDKLEDVVLQEIVRILDVELRLPGETIYDLGDQADCLYIIISGSVTLSLREDPALKLRSEILDQIQKGDVYGEVAILMDTTRESMAVSDGFLEQYVLSSSNLEIVLNELPDVNERLKQRAQVRAEQLFGGILEQEGAHWKRKVAPNNAFKWRRLCRKLMISKGTSSNVFFSRIFNFTMAHSDSNTKVKGKLTKRSKDNDMYFSFDSDGRKSLNLHKPLAHSSRHGSFDSSSSASALLANGTLLKREEEVLERSMVLVMEVEKMMLEAVELCGKEKEEGGRSLKDQEELLKTSLQQQQLLASQLLLLQSLIRPPALHHAGVALVSSSKRRLSQPMLAASIGFTKHCEIEEETERMRGIEDEKDEKENGEENGAAGLSGSVNV